MQKIRSKSEVQAQMPGVNQIYWRVKFGASLLCWAQGILNCSIRENSKP